MNIQGVIFDKDGTLFDFQATWGAWAGRAIADISAGDAAIEAALIDIWGFDPKTQTLLPESMVIASTPAQIGAAAMPVTGLSITEMQSRMTMGAAQAPQVIVPHCRETILHLKNTGLRLAVMTNDEEVPARAHLQRDDLLPLFSPIVGSDSGRGAKPAPDPLLSIADEWGISSANIAMVGDSLHDLHAAKSAGMKAIGVLTGVATKRDLAPHADVVLDSVADLPAWLVQQ